jgi:hypothetical protein
MIDSVGWSAHTSAEIEDRWRKSRVGHPPGKAKTGFGESAPKRATTTGSTGQDGSHMAELLLDKGMVRRVALEHPLHGLWRPAFTQGAATAKHAARSPAGEACSRAWTEAGTYLPS